MTTKIETRNLDDLTIHPAIKAQPRLSDDELLGWRRSLKWRGENLVPPITITAENEIVDGRHRFWCAKKLGWKTIPVTVCAEHEISQVIVGSLASRRAYSKAQIAFTLSQFVDPDLNESRILAGINQNQTLRTGAGGGRFSTSELAEVIGCSSRIIQQALELRGIFEQDKIKRTLTDRDGVTVTDVTLEHFFLPRIMLNEDPEAPRTRAYGLGAVIAACTAIQKMEGKDAPHGGGRPREIQQQLSLFGSSINAFGAKFDYWKKWEPETRQAAIAALPPVVEKMPDDLLAEFSKCIKTELKRREK